jgi:two-component system CheB/CheR fusion protein
MNQDVAEINTVSQAALEHQLQESEQRYQAFTELTSDFCHVCTRTAHGSYRVQWIGGRFEQITGYPIEELYEIGCWLPIVHPDDQEQVEAKLLRLRPHDEIVSEFRIVRKDTMIRWMQQRSRCVKDPHQPEQLRLYGTARDITQERENSFALSAAESAYRSIFNSVNDAIFVHTLDGGLILDVNQRACEMYRYPREELIGATPLDLTSGLTEELSQEALQRIELAQKGKTQIFEWQAQCKDGTPFWVEVNLRGAKINGRNRILAVVRDISERKQAALDLQRARDAAQSATVAKNEFLANMSHEVRTPLNGIMGVSQLLRTTDLSDEQQGYMDMLDSSARNLLLLINDILDISKIEAGSLSLNQTAFSPAKLLREVASIYEKPAEEKGISLTILPAEDLPTALVGDQLRLKQILINLVGNAIKFTRHGGVAVTVSRLPDPSEGFTLRFEVADSGIGMADEILQKIFLPFTQADASTSRMHGGSGLGLAICRRLSELMGGSIRVESVLGHGSRFIVELPFGCYSNQELAASPEIAAPVREMLPPQRILLVEDQEVNRTFVQRLLERQGHQVVPAVDGLMALDLLERDTYNLMLLDIQMPGMGGEEVMARLRKEEQYNVAHLPTIALTAHALAGDREKLLESGFDGYVAKPVQMDLLLAEMGSVLGLKGNRYQ